MTSNQDGTGTSSKPGGNSGSQEKLSKFDTDLSRKILKRITGVRIQEGDITIVATLAKKGKEGVKKKWEEFRSRRKKR